jgi:hypothetical protein
MYAAYIADPKNTPPSIEVVWCEEPVTLILPPDDTDPTGQNVVISGTLDQVRRYPDGSLKVWDIKTSKLSVDDQLQEYVVQQVIYTCAAQATLDPGIQMGGLICTRNYTVARAKIHVPWPLTFTASVRTMLLDSLRLAVANVRRGKKTFHPSVSACRFCEVKPYPNCITHYERYQ